MTEQEFSGLCAAHGFGQVASTIYRSVLPCIGFSLRQGRGSSANSSKLGGFPAVPLSFEWPIYKGRALDFLLQVNLEGVHLYDSTGLLPSGGMLTFFYDVGRQPWGFDPEDLAFFKVCYFPATVELRSAMPPARRLNSETLPEHGIDFWRAVSLPNHGSRAWERLVKQIEKPGAEFDISSFVRLSEAVFRLEAPTPDGPRHQLGGHSHNVQNDMQLEAQLVTNGLYCGDGSGYRDPRRPELEKTCEEWRLLLQLDSDDTAKLMWGDLGMLYFWVRQPELMQSDFSHPWMTLQCG